MKRDWLLAGLAFAAAPWIAAAELRASTRPEHEAPPAAERPPSNPAPPERHPNGHGRPFAFGAPVKIIERPRREDQKRHSTALADESPDLSQSYPREVTISGGVEAPQARFFTYRGRSLPALQGGLYAYPVGYVDQRWRQGQFLPIIFIAPVYYFLDWQALGLPPPPPDCRWVRYGHDLVLVNLRTGEVLDVVYGAII
jgi:Ni/Co efflux regulator RcnB